MYYRVLASDYDGTLASHGELRPATEAALRRVAASGRRLVLVTGRTMEELLVAGIDYTLFDSTVSENGAVVWNRATERDRLLAAPITDQTVAALEQWGITPLHIGRVIASTSIDQAASLRRAVAELGLDLMLCPNKRSLMLLPPTIDKAVGLRAALADLGESPAHTVACGDAENDITMLKAVGCGVAVANALPEVKLHASIVTGADHGEGVVEVIEGLLADDLRGMLADRADPKAG